MFSKSICHSNFVCLDDITEIQEPMNHVIYNPNIHPVDVRKCRLFEIVKVRFGKELTESQLVSLTRYDGKHLNEFIQELRQTLRSLYRE